MGEAFQDVLKERGVKNAVRNDKVYMAEYRKLMDKWYKWAQKHEVAESGICEEHATNKTGGVAG